MNADELNVEVLPIPNGGWRVSDKTIDECDGVGVLGFVEEIESRFETFMLGAPGHRHVCETFAEAVELLATQPRHCTDR